MEKGRGGRGTEGQGILGNEVHFHFRHPGFVGGVRERRERRRERKELWYPVRTGPKSVLRCREISSPSGLPDPTSSVHEPPKGRRSYSLMFLCKFVFHSVHIRRLLGPLYEPTETRGDHGPLWGPKRSGD